VRCLYPPGIAVHVLADAALYASAFQTHQTEVDTYYSTLHDRIRFLDADRCVKLHDYSELLRRECHPDYQRLYYSYGKLVWSGDPSRLIPNTDLETLRRSVRCSVNTRRFQLGHKDHRAIFGPSQFRYPDHTHHELIERLTDIALREVIAIRLACAEVDISTRLWPQAIRATCHKGPKNGRWAIGLKPYPEYYGSCKLLPYHGMPVVRLNSHKRPKLTIVPEVLLRSDISLTRVVLDGSDEVYFYLDSSINASIA